MNEMEIQARQNHKQGNNCSCSLAMAFADKMHMKAEEAKQTVPPPRSIDGKCGAYLSAVTILEKLGPDRVQEFEEAFLEQNGSLKCKEILAGRAVTGRTCNDVIGEAAAKLEAVISEQEK